MPVFRVERNKGYTVMSNYHLRDKSLSLKAKGLLSQILSLPEDWDYTLSGLCCINRESKDAIRSAVNELERAGYIERHQTTDESGKFSSNEYIIREQPVSLPPSLDKPSSENPTTGKPTSENPMQLNKDRVTKDQAITDPSITHSFPSLSPPPLVGTSSASLASPQAAKLTRCAVPPLPTQPASLGLRGGPGVAASPPERKGTEAATQSAVEIYRDIIKENIEYDHLLRHSKIDPEELDGIVELLVETVCTARKTIRVAGDDYPAELVKAKLLKLNSGHIEFVMDCMRENTTKIRNIKKYLLAVLFNAPSTMGSYYNYYILNVKLSARSIVSVAPELLTPEQLEMFNVYLETSGNNPLVFGGGSPDISASEDISGVHFVNGTRPGNTAVVDIAKSQVGNVNGQPYWSWYGFDSRVAWCACFVSWCYNQAGLSEPRFSGCTSGGMAWFQSRGQWTNRGYSDIAPGDAIFFDWDNSGNADHVGIVIGTDGTNVYTVEGNSGNACKIKSYPLNSSVIRGYGLMNWD